MQKRLFGLLSSAMLVAAACGGATATGSPAGSAPAPAGSTAPVASGSTDPAASGSTEPAASGTAPTASEGASPSAGGGTDDTFTFVVDSEPTTLATEPDDLPTSWITGMLYGSLYGPNYKLEYQPALAASLPDISADGLTWTVKLRDGVLFHDGSPMTSADVKFSYDLHLSPNCRGNPDTCSSIADNVASVEAPDASTLVFTLKQKFAPFLSSGLGTVYIVPKAALEASLQRFQAAAGGVSKEEVKALVDKVSAATATADAEENPTACVPAEGATAPAECLFATYTAELEALLGKAKVETANKAQFNTAGESGTDFDPEAYAQALLGQASDLDRTLNATAVDQIAAAIKILDFGKNPIGTGPYKFVKYNAGQNVEMARWEKYSSDKVDPAKIPAKAFAVVIRSSAAATTALGNDEIQWQPKIESDAFTTIKDNPNVQLAEYADNGYYYIALNLRKGRPYADKALRQAFGMCIDHTETVKVATGGNGQPVYANTPPFSFAFNPDVAKYTLDVAGAKAKIEGAGWALGGDGIYAKDGKKLSSTLFVRVGRPQRLAFAQLAKDQLRECGIDITVQEGDLNTVLIPKVLDFPNEFDTYLGGWSTAFDPDDYSIFHSTEIPTKDKPAANNFPGWKNDEADKLLEQGRTETDTAKRKEIYFKFQNLIHEEAPYYFLWSDLAHTGLSKRIGSQGEPLDLTSVAINYYQQDAWTVAPK
jgi:ABC-type transport system substrate-binding protein